MSAKVLPHIKKLIVPNLLFEHIKNFSDKEQWKYCFIPSYIKIKIDKNNQYNNASIPRIVWLDAIGSNYRNYIDDLLEWNIINIQEDEFGNESYHYKNGNSSYFDATKSHNQAFCKTYSLTTQSITSGFYHINFTKRKSITLTVKQNVTKNSLDTKDPVINYYINSYKNIELVNYNPTTNKENLNKPIICVDQWEVDSITDSINDKHWLDKIYRGDINLHYGGVCNRLYHPLICMSQNARDLVKYKESDSVYYYDIKSCFPALLCKIMDKSELDFYKTCLDEDIYNIISGDISKRDITKTHFNQFMNGFIKNDVFNWFFINMPKSFNIISSRYKTLSREFQLLESDIMVQRLTKFYINNNIHNIIGMHDGWVNPVITHNDIIKEFVINEVFKEVNYKVTIKENLNKPIICVDQWEIDSKDFILDSIKSSKPFIILTERLRCNKISKKKASDRMYVTRGTGAFHKHEKRWKMLKIENAVITEKIKGMMK